MKIFCLDGGVGRSITSLPSFLKYYKNHPDEEWYIMMFGFEHVVWGIPELQNRTFSPETKGVWENIFLKSDSVITLEPYRVPNFYKQKINLAESFDELVNETTEHSDLKYETLQLSQQEIKTGRDIIHQSFEKFKKDRTIVINPYGSTAHCFLDEVFDDTLRSIPEDLFLKLSNLLSEDYNIIYMGYDDLIKKDCDFIFFPDSKINIREWMGIIGQVDYFIGCDSAGQHIARSLGTKGSIFMGGTSSINMSYPDNFLIFEKEFANYMPLRISEFQTNLSSKLNSKNWNYSDEEIYECYLKIKEDIETIPL